MTKGQPKPNQVQAKMVKMRRRGEKFKGAWVQMAYCEPIAILAYAQATKAHIGVCPTWPWTSGPCSLIHGPSPRSLVLGPGPWLWALVQFRDPPLRFTVPKTGGGPHLVLT